jgi:hypothetical protein
MRATETKAFKETNQWVIALLVAGLIGVLVLSLYLWPTQGFDKAMPLATTTLGIFLTAIGLQSKNTTVMGVLALASILIATGASLYDLSTSSQTSACPAVAVSQVK